MVDKNYMRVVECNVADLRAHKDAVVGALLAGRIDGVKITLDASHSDMFNADNVVMLRREKKPEIPVSQEFFFLRKDQSVVEKCGLQIAHHSIEDVLNYSQRTSEEMDYYGGLFSDASPVGDNKFAHLVAVPTQHYMRFGLCRMYVTIDLGALLKDEAGSGYAPPAP